VRAEMGDEVVAKESLNIISSVTHVSFKSSGAK
jgi:hypothetical protein